MANQNRWGSEHAGRKVTDGGGLQAEHTTRVFVRPGQRLAEEGALADRVRGPLCTALHNDFRVARY
jgi:hypothetical protein